MSERQIIHKYGCHKQEYSQVRPVFERRVANPRDGVSSSWLARARLDGAEPKTEPALRQALRPPPQDRPPAANRHRQAKRPSNRMNCLCRSQNRRYTTAPIEPARHHLNVHLKFAIRAYRCQQVPPRPRPSKMPPTRNHAPIAQSQDSQQPQKHIHPKRSALHQCGQLNQPKWVLPANSQKNRHH